MSIVRLRTPGKPRSAFLPPPEEGQVRALRLHRRLAVVGAILGLLIGIVAFLPASLVAGAVARSTNDQFLLAEADGTVWNGSALPVLTGGAGSRDASALPSRLEWRLRPRWNGLVLHLAQDCCLPHGVDVSIGRGLGGWRVSVVGPGDAAGPARAASGVSASDGDVIAGQSPIAQWPAGWLEGAGFPFNTVHPGGLLTLTTQNLAFFIEGGRALVTGSAQLEIRQASSRLSTLDTLGTYRVLIQADPSAMAPSGAGSSRALLWVSTLEGALVVDGRGLISAGHFQLRAQAHAAPGSEPALDNLLNLIGRRNGALSVISIG